MFRFDELEEKRRRRIGQLVNLCHKYVAEYTIVSTEPLIFFLPIFLNLRDYTRDYRFLFDSLKDRKAYVVCCTWWHFENSRNINELEELLKKFKFDYPGFTFVFLCNTARQSELFAEKSINAVFCNNNCFIDEKLFFPVLSAEKKFDAVYDGRLADWKRHYLAAGIDSIGLIYYAIPWYEDNSYMKKVIADFNYAEFFNHGASGEYRKLSPVQVNRAINQCRVGLCLSAEEGAMYASIQYLLAGLPVVTTPNVGGRDEFFDDEIAVTVEPTPEAVREGVREMIARNIPADFIRARTLKKMEEHRAAFVELIQNIYEREGISRNFSDEWNGLFYNKLLRNQNHLETIARLKSAD